MILLDGRSLTAARVIPLESMNLQLKEREGTAAITPADMDGISVGAWMKDDRAPEAGIVWRVRSIQETFNTRTPQVQLEHAIATLKDQILFGEHKPADISGTSGATTCTARQAVEYILARQGDWTLGGFDYDSVSNPYKFDGESLYEALEIVTNSLEDALWTYDFTSYPFTISITAHSSDVDSELRASRNLRTISRTVDKSGMFTRFYPIGKDDLHIPGEYVEKNATAYGVISKVETDQTLDTVEELTRWANERLNDHAEPVVTVAAEGLELSRDTGEALDALTIGRVCRIPLPEYGTTIQERIVEKTYQDKVRQPEVVKITLANSRADVTKIIAELIRKGGGGGRASARQQKEDHAWFEDTNDHVAMCAVGIIGVDAQGNPNWTRMSEFIADGEGLHAKVETQMQGVTDRVSSLEINENEIRADVAAASSTMYSVVSQTATSFYTEVSRKARVYVQETDPSMTPGITLIKGDIWVKSVKVQSWNDMASRTWTGANSFDWNQYAGAPQYVWDGSRWEKIGDSGAFEEYRTKIIQNDQHIQLLAQAVNAIDPNAIAQASLDVSAEAITAAVSTAKSELYSIIRQTATNIVSEVVDDINGISSYVDQTASSMNQAIARKNKVFVQLSDPASGNTVIDGDIWIKSVGNDNLKPTWTELSAKTWASQNSTNWREYYEGYWYVRKNGAWERMNANADVVEIGTMLEWDEKHLAMVARTVDENHIEMGSRLEVTAQYIRGEVHAAKSNLYSVIEQTATQIRARVADVENGLSSTLTVTASQIRSEVASAKSSLSSSITQTASQIRAEVASTASSLQSAITQQANKISLVVEGTGSNAHIKPAEIIESINNGSSNIKLSADHIDIDGVVTALGAKSIGCGGLTVEGFSEFYKTAEFGQGIMLDAGATISMPSGALKMGNYNASWKSKSVITSVSRSNTRYIVYAVNGNVENLSTMLGSLVTGTDSETIYYLGR